MPSPKSVLGYCEIAFPPPVAEQTAVWLLKDSWDRNICGVRFARVGATDAFLSALVPYLRQGAKMRKP